MKQLKKKTKKTVKKVAKAPVQVKKTQGLGKVKQTRTQILNTIAQTTNLTKIQVEQVFMAMNDLVAKHMKKGCSGEFTIPMSGIKIRCVEKKATKAREMLSPLTGDVVMIKAKPKRRTVKVTALKALKEKVAK